jgi:hypothetical protein
VPLKQSCGTNYENEREITVMSAPKNVYPVCFWCGNAFEEPIVVSDNFTQAEKESLPEQCLVHYDPCPSCMAGWTEGRVFIEYDDISVFELQPPLTRPDKTQFYPTGRIAIPSLQQALVLFPGLEEIEPISFLNKKNFADRFDKEPELSCFWCGKPFFGEAKTNSPIKSIESYEPCNACKAKWTGKCTFIECDTVSVRAIDGVFITLENLPMTPTGRLMRVELSEAKRIFGDVSDIEFITSAQFRILSGEDKPKERSVSAKVSASGGNSGNNRKSLLARNDDY